MTPGDYKQKGKGLILEYGFIATPFGTALIATSKRSICHLHFVTASKRQSLQEMSDRWPLSEFVENQKRANAFCDDIFIKGKPMDIQTIGTPFQLKVWEALLRIPEGRIATYGHVAEMIGEPNSARAVGTAIARNEVAFIIPCHRVIKANGVIGEYRWGIAKKQTLLCYEAAKNPKSGGGGG